MMRHAEDVPPEDEIGDAAASAAEQQLVEDLRERFPIPDRAARAYLENADAMRLEVDRAVLDRDDRAELVGEGGAELVRLNHENHVRFMANVFGLNLPRMLVKVVPWVYQAYAAHGFSLDYFPVELEAWREAARKHLEPEAAKAVGAIYGWMLDEHETMAGLSVTAGVKLAKPVKLSDAAEEALEVLIKGDARRYVALVGEHMAARENLPGFYLGVVEPVMYEIGDMWQRGQITPAQEHLATAVVSRGMAAAYERLPMGPDDKGRVVVSASADEQHELGGRVAADLLETDGWDVRFVGANTPPEALADFAAQDPPEIVALSVTMPYNLLAVRTAVRALRRRDELDTTRVMVGGQGLALDPDAWRAVEADAWAPGGAAAAEVALTCIEEG